MKAKSLLDINHDETLAPSSEVLHYLNILVELEAHQQELLIEHAKLKINENDSTLKFFMKLKSIGADTQVNKSCFLLISTISLNDIQNKLWAHTIQQISQKIQRTVSILDILTHFPKGLPTEKQHIEIWESNNTEGKNKLDQPNTYGLKKFI
ncbi:hypothetical protein [Pseudoalteromonas marina]|uniref:Flagellar protein FlgN n=1 Tax=Pseudoalteromonas marina TaxID=267375 RepID=A0ABT9FCE2_9GAMM|nr:hypothetical protein [Pseudoalteromonas marina]MDP2564454.1 hypothetical protein [Pseudoalteromonas marina]